MTSSITSRVESLRQWMLSQNLDAFIVPSTDPHNSEYPADHWKIREWISGFDGSAGTVLITQQAAALWTDSRYFLQADQQLADTPFSLMREGEALTPTFTEWLETQTRTSSAKAPCRVGFVAASMPYALWQNGWASNIELVPCDDIFATLWVDRPPLTTAPIYIQPLAYAGLSVTEKLHRIVEESREEWDFYLMNDLSEIAWTLNLRGADILYNPLFMSYLIVRRKGGAILFTEESRVSEEVRQYLCEHHIELLPYDGWRDFIVQHSPLHHAYAFADSLSAEVFLQLREALKLQSNPEATSKTTFQPSSFSVASMRAVKNNDEIEGFRQAMLYDGVALVKFRRWLDERISKGKIHKETEHSVAQKLAAFRAECKDFRGLSFATIAGYEANGAIVHYEPTAEHHAPLSGSGLLLLDSGAQYHCGTTDITRTIALGELTEEHRKVYTLVLKGHIALSRAHFPEGTTGLQLDLAARYAMWQQGYDFGHGTGHGVGSHLCVHEGPQQIRKNLRACTLQAFALGMTITNEPGIYVEGKFGVRIENVLLCRSHEHTPFGHFLDFETLTLCPIDTAPIALSLLDESERQWLNAYHLMVRQRLLPLLHEEADRQWLLAATAEL